MRSEKIKWTVQVRLSHRHKWKAKGTFETRSAARARAKSLQRAHWEPFHGALTSKRIVDGAGFGNTRVVKKITGGL